MVLEVAIARLRMAEYLIDLTDSPEIPTEDHNCFPQPPEMR
jgi:hypothetical protein